MSRQTLNCVDDALWQAVTHKDIDAVQRALRDGGNVNSLSPDGWVDSANAGSGGKSLLYHAAWVGSLPIFRLLVENGADVDARRQKNWSSPRGNTPFHQAVFYGRHDIVRYCLDELHIDPNLQGEQGYTALHVASMYGYDAIVETLLQHGARTDMLTKNERTPIHVAKNDNIKRLLLDAQATQKNPKLPTRAEAAWNAGVEMRNAMSDSHNRRSDSMGSIARPSQQQQQRQQQPRLQPSNAKALRATGWQYPNYSSASSSSAAAAPRLPDEKIRMDAGSDVDSSLNDSAISAVEDENVVPFTAKTHQYRGRETYADAGHKSSSSSMLPPLTQSTNLQRRNSKTGLSSSSSSSHNNIFGSSSNNSNNSNNNNNNNSDRWMTSSSVYGARSGVARLHRR